MAAPFNPLTGPLPTTSAISLRARRRAHADTLAKMATVASPDVIRAENASLLKSLQGSLTPFSQIVQNASKDYSHDVQGAANDQSAAGAAVGLPAGTPAPPNTRGGLLGALGASTLGNLQGNLTAAQVALPGMIAANAGQRSSIAAGENSLFENYYQQGLDDALKTAAAQQNAQFAGAQLGLSADRNTIAQQNADANTSRAQTAADRARQLAGQVKADPAMQRALQKAASAAAAVIHGNPRDSVRGATYSFSIPGKKDELSGKIGKPLVINVEAANGPAAQQAFIARVRALQGTGGLAGLDVSHNPIAHPGLYYTTRKDHHVKITTAGSWNDAVNAAALILRAAGLSNNDALHQAKVIVGPRPKKKRHVAPVDHVGGPH